MATQQRKPSPERGLRVGVARYSRPTPENLNVLKQLGVDDIILTRWEHDGIDSAMPVGEVWETGSLENLKKQVNDIGLNLLAIQTMPISLYDVLLDEDCFDENVEIITKTIRNLGEVGIEILGYSGHPPGGFSRTSTVEIRGGAQAARFDASELEGSTENTASVPTEAELWNRYEQFLRRVIPVAEEAGVTLALHPSDPPVEEISGIPMLFNNFENFKRSMELVPSENHGLKFCLGCWSEMGADIEEVIRYFGGENIVYVHFRDVVGTIPDFYETFIDDEESNTDEFEVMELLHDVGFDGVVIPDHVPELTGEPEWEYGGLGGYAYTIGYLRALIKAVTRDT